MLELVETEEAAQAFDQIGGKFAVVKAQVHAGGRGKAGGVKVVKSSQEAREVAEREAKRLRQTEAMQDFPAEALKYHRGLAESTASTWRM